MPGFARDGGEEPEIAGIYIISPDGMPFRIGYALGNEFSDHVTERENYLWLAHSKLRACAVGPELLVGELPEDVRGVSRILRGNAVLWEKPFVSGEANMSHAHLQSRTAPFQIPAVPPAGRRACAFLRHGDAELLRQHPHRAGRHVRDRGRAVRASPAQPARA